MLPTHCVELLDAFVALEGALGLCRARSQPAFFSTVRFSVERATGRAFTPRHLQQLLGAVPDALAVHVAKRRAAGAPGGGGGGGVSGVNFDGGGSSSEFD